MTHIQSNLNHLINTLFKPDERKLIFWFDPEREFQETFNTITLPGFEKHTLTDYNQIAIKFSLETDKVNTNTILYCPFQEKPAKEDPLYDLLCQGQKFAADRISLLMSELKLNRQECREILNNPFFKNKMRIEKLKPMLFGDITAQQLPKAMLFSLTGINDLNAFKDVLIHLFEEGLDRAELIEEWDKYQLESVFWNLVRLEYGYSKSASIRELAAHLCLSAWDAEGNGIPENRKPCVVDRPEQALIFINHWKQQNPASCRIFTQTVEKHLQIRDELGEMTPDHWVESKIFPVFEKACLYKAIRLLLNDQTEEARAWLDHRPLADSVTARLLHPARTFFEAVSRFMEDTRTEDPYKAYARDHYQVDQSYRQFYTLWDEHLEWGEDEHKLRDKMEHVYINQFLPQCSLRWEAYLDSIGIWEQWPKGLPTEHQQFFAQQVVSGYRNNRTYVIISDALRYEVGMELTDVLRKELRGEVSCEPMVSTIPSYTQLGMAALLPMKNPSESLGYSGKDNVTVDGLSSQGTENRAKIIQATWPDGTAIRYKDFMAMSSKQGKAWQKDFQIVYVYHDAIDEIGDNAKTEEKAFKAAKEGIEELRNLVQRITNLSVSNILITADHGFLYQRTKLDQIDKVKVATPDQELLGKNRRFYLAPNLQPSENCNLIDMSYVLGKDTNIKALVARGHQRISRQGAGANFVHGGASLQEIMIPLIKFKHRKAGATGSERARMVDITILFAGTIKSNNISISLQQSEPLGDKRTARPLQVGIYDLKTNALLSSVGTVLFNSTEKDRADRIQIVKLKGGKELADKHEAELRLMSPEGEVYKRMNCQVRIYFQDDFGL